MVVTLEITLVWGIVRTLHLRACLYKLRFYRLDLVG
jgi:hypothetical protein